MTIGFSKPINRTWPFGYLFSWSIRAVENTEYSHVFISWKSDNLDRELVYEASGTSVHFVGKERFLKKAKIVHSYEIHITEEARKKVIQKAIDYAEAPYGIKQVVGILIVKMARLLGRQIKNPLSDGTATWVCSELIADFFEELDLALEVDKENATPKDIKLALDKSHKAVKVNS